MVVGGGGGEAGGRNHGSPAQGSLLNPLLVLDNISDQLDQVTIDFRDYNFILNCRSYLIRINQN